MNAIVDGTISQSEVITREQTELAEREGRIERAQRNAYYETGLELRAIRDLKLYKVKRAVPVAGRYSFETFEEYCEKRWDMDSSRARQLIGAAEAAEKIATIVTILPGRESHVRPLLALESDEERAAVWSSVVERHGQTIRAKDVEEEIERFQAAKSKDWVTLEEWKRASDDDRARYLKMGGDSKFNEQDNNSIEWAHWSWNPVTGCKHDCPYCYARDIAERFYPDDYGFAPTIHPSRLNAPANMGAPKKTSVADRNVFTCSMADLFGRWVPQEWIDAVLDSVRKAPEWNFLFLTKFPKRLAGIKFPDNAWVGTTVDCNARLKSAEDAFEKVQAKVKWLSIEPMIEPLKFSRLSLFQWIVIGGSSRSTQTPEWRVPFDWWAPLHLEAKSLGLTVYHKDNLMTERERGYPGHPHVNPKRAPEPFHYLGGKKKAEVELGEE